ncbi:MAG: PD40 domain-containing protein, partial [Bacteroidales bacterium]|nr:PD40 domain-containing protein [Candidatus Cryptobacteroides fimicaballi]
MKKLLSTAVFVLAATLISAASTPLWLRDVKISPDGEKILFCYKGDIFVVASEGGAAQRLTSLPSYEQTPFWSPDGSTIAFASDRNGSHDVYTMPCEGGAATRLTCNSATELPIGFTPDG